MKIKFEYSIPYDRMLTVMSMNEYHEKQKDEVKDYIFMLGESWKGVEKRIIRGIEKAAGLKFKEDATCYVVKNMADYAISHPLTLKMEKNLDRANVVLMHELIHILFVQNKKAEKMLECLSKKYPKQSLYFKVHLPLFLVQRKAIEGILGQAYFSKVLKEEVKLEEGYIWNDANALYPNFKKDVVKFFKT